MNIPIKTQAEIEVMRHGGKILSKVLEETMKRAISGISTWELDRFAEEMIRKEGGIPAFKGYSGFPATLCTNINEVVVHGIPRKNEILKEGDLFTIDCGVIYKGFYTDAARSVVIGNKPASKVEMVKTAYEALSKAIDMAGPGVRLGEISKTIQNTIESAGFNVVKDLTGHGVGKHLHEDPIILNFFDGDMGPILKPGMTLAIEPIFSMGSSEIITLKDNWTITTDDQSCAVQVENTILITQNGNEILTVL
jgi:methionyl aminopeptidase